MLWNQDYLGYAAAVCTTTAFIPQALQVWRTRAVDDISAGMYSVLVLGVALWLAYGLVLAAWPIIIANGITLALAASILAMKLRFGARPAGPV